MGISIRAKIFGMAGIQLALMIILSGYVIVKMSGIGDEIVEIAEEDLPLILEISEITERQLEMEITVERALRHAHTGGHEELLKEEEEKFRAEIKNIQEHIKKGKEIAQKALKNSKTAEGKKEFKEVYDHLRIIEKEEKDYREHVEKIFVLLDQGKLKETERLVSLLEKEEAELANEVKAFLKQIETFTLQSALQAESDEAEAHISIIIFILFTLGFSAAFSIFLSQQILIPLLKLKESAEEIAAGKLDAKIEVTSKDEIGQACMAFNNMAEDLQKARNLNIASLEQQKELFGNAIAVAKKIASGDYNTPVTMGGVKEADEFRQSMDDMRENLKILSAESKHQTWLSKSAIGLSEKLRGTEDLKTATKNIINYLANTVDAKVGALYIYKDEFLNMSASYAFKGTDDSYKIKLGEGLVGQVGKERKSILLNDVPKDYIKIKTSGDDITPDSLYLMPIIYDQNLKGVIELGKISGFSKADIKMLDESAEPIAIAVNSRQSRSRSDELLKESQQMTEELQKLSEELQETNEQMEEQTQVLQKSVSNPKI